MRKQSLFWVGRLCVCLLAAMCAGVAFAQTAVTTLDFSGPEVQSERSGAAGAARRLVLSGPKGLKTIAWEERRDNPCVIEIRGRNISNMGLTQNEELNLCGVGESVRYETVGFAEDASLIYVSGLRVCMDRGGERVKGIQVRGRITASNGTLTAGSREPRFERPNCHEWRRWVECPANHIASGLIADFDAGKEPRSMTGISLICRRVVATTTVSFAPRLTGPTTTLGTISGSGGEAVDLLPGGGAFGLDYIHWAERRDKPCVLKVEARDLLERNKRTDQTSNKCGKQDVEGKYNFSTASMRLENDNMFITALRVCTNNSRVKGVQVEGKVPVSKTDPSPPKPRVEQDTGWQVNCAVAAASGSFDGEWVRCGKGQIAVGLRAYFERTEEPRSLRGLTLICRAYE